MRFKDYIIREQENGVVELRRTKYPRFVSHYRFNDKGQVSLIAEGIRHEIDRLPFAEIDAIQREYMPIIDAYMYGTREVPKNEFSLRIFGRTLFTLRWRKRGWFKEYYARNGQKYRTMWGAIKVVPAKGGYKASFNGKPVDLTKIDKI